MRCRCHAVEFIAGDYADVLIYPEYREQPQRGRRKKWRPSSEDQQLRNDIYAELHFKGLVHANFTERDCKVEFTYSNEHNPETEKQARRDFTNYVRRDKAYRVRHGLPPLDYLYTIERGAQKGRYHIHAIMRGGLAEEIQGIWGKGIVRVTKLLFNQQTGLADLSAYMCKSGKYKRRWTSSKGLKQPVRVDKPNFTTQKKAREIAASPDDRQAIETLFPGWRVAGDGCKVYHSSYDNRPILRISLYRDIPKRRKKAPAQGKGKAPYAMRN